MTKARFIELVYLRIYGGRPSTDFSVLKVDIEAYLPAAVNYAMTKSYYTERNGDGSADIPTNFYQNFKDLPILTDADRKDRKYIDLPAGLVSMPANRGLRQVMDNCDNVLAPLPDAYTSNLNYWLKTIPSEKFYRLEGKKIFLFNLPVVAKTLKVNMIVSADELDGSAELSIPAGLEAEALDLCFDFATGARKLPVDRKIDTRDIN